MKTIETLALPPQSPGTARHLKIHRYGTKGATPKVYIQASLHADEVPALLVAQHLVARLDQEAAAGRIRGEVVLVPVANPIGLAQVIDGSHLGRYDFASGENFNRSFPDLSPLAAERLRGKLGSDAAANVRLIRRVFLEILAEQKPPTELATLRLHLMSLAIDADIVLDLHCDNDALMHLYLGEARWPDGADLSAELGSVATLLAADSGGTPFDETFSNVWAKLRTLLGPDHPIPDACRASTVELRGQGDVRDDLAAADAAALLRFLMRQGVIEGDPGPLPKPKCDGTKLSAMDVLRAPVPGVLVYLKELGAQVVAGEVIAEIIDPLAEIPAKSRTPVRTLTDGVFFARKIERLTRPGQSIGKIAGTTELPTRKGTLLDP
jgi:predicted deacylase